MTEEEIQNIKLEKVDDKTAYENLLVKYAELENKIADIKANCDLAIEGRDLKIKELEQKLEQTEKDLADYQFNYPTIKELEQEKRLLGERCNQLLKDKGELTDQIADIKANCDLAIEGRDIKIKELEEENAELKEKYVKECEDVTYVVTNYNKQLTKAKDLLKKMYYLYHDPCVTNKDLKNRDKLFEEVKQFIKEIEK